MMVKELKWSAKFSIGHPLIDQQHQRLFAMLAAIQQQVHNNDNKALLYQSLKELLAYTEYHFKDEEALMRQTAYPDYTLHRVLHDKLLNQVEDMLDNLSNGEVVSIDELLLFLTDWLVEHILVEDLALNKYIETQAKP